MLEYAFVGPVFAGPRNRCLNGRERPHDGDAPACADMKRSVGVASPSHTVLSRNARNLIVAGVARTHRGTVKRFAPIHTNAES